MPTMRRLFLAVVLARCPIQQRTHAISDGRDAVVGEVRDDVHGVLHAVAHSAHETPLREVVGGAVDAAVPGIHDGAHTSAEQIDGVLCRLCPSALRIFGEPQCVRHEAHAPQRRAAHELGDIGDRAASFGDDTVVLIVLIVLLRHQHELRGRRRCLGLLPLRWCRAAQHCRLYTLVRRHLGGLLEALLGDLVLESGHHLLAELQQIQRVQRVRLGLRGRHVRGQSLSDARVFGRNGRDLAGDSIALCDGQREDPLHANYPVDHRVHLMHCADLEADHLTAGSGHHVDPPGASSLDRSRGCHHL
mmetsp:Transcript_81390/g.264198  ORF Transcript_81390/g.264198 Transcript_81390/m.264198 type:complete len:303 (+) Transcript_81390:485-1393(+)